MLAANTAFISNYQSRTNGSRNENANHMSTQSPSPNALRVADLSKDGAAFLVTPDAGVLRTLAGDLEVNALRKVRFEGRIKPVGDRDWRLEGRLGATIEQTCDVTLEPVRTRVDAPVIRLFMADFEMPDVPEAEMPEDDSLEPLGAWIDPEAILVEALSLEVPQYPRAAGAAFEGAQFAEAGTTPMTDEAAKPFAGLADLRDKLENKDS